MQTRPLQGLTPAVILATLVLSACSPQQSASVLLPQTAAAHRFQPSVNRSKHFGDVTTVLKTGGLKALAWDPDDRILVGIPNGGYYSQPSVLLGSQGAFVFPPSATGAVYDSHAHLFYFSYQHELYSSDAKGRLKTVTTLFGNASAMTVDPGGSVYAIDGDHIDRVRDGKVTIIAQPGTVTQNSGQIGGTPSLAFDIADRSLYLTDSYGDVVKRILPNGHAVVVAGHCIGGYNGYGCTPGSIEGKGTNALFGSPGGLVYDARRDVLVMADFTNNQLWELHADGQALVAAGYGPSADYDGNAWRAFFGGPNALVYSKDQGEIFVSDYGRLSAYAVTGPHAPTVAQPTVRFPFSNPNAQMGFPTVSSGNAWFVVDGSIVNIAPTGQRHYYKPPARPSAFGQIAIDRQGNLWLLVQNGILSMSPDGKFRRFNLRKGTIANLNSPIIGPDGNPWFADQDFTAPAIATVVNGKIVTYSLGSGLSAPRPGWLITGPDGSVWYTTGQDEIDRISTSGKPLSPIRLKKVSPSQMVYNKKSGDVWFLDSYADNTAYRMTPDHAVHTFSLKCGCAAGSSNITVTPNDTAFVAENNGGAIAGVTPDGRLMGYYMPSQSSGVYGIAAATDTSLWITTLAGQVFLFDPAQYVKSGLPPNPLVGSGSY